MRTGKLSSTELNEAVLSQISHRRKEVISGAAIGEDCASFCADGLVLVSTDPVTGETADIGSLAVKVATNDIWAGGGEPFLAMITVIAPVTYTAEEIRRIMVDAEAEASRQNVEIAGGHTEFSDAVNRVIISCTALGFAAKHYKVNATEVGDGIVVTKHIALEGTALLAEAFRERLTAKLGEELIDEALALGNLTGVGAESKIAKRCNISSMHDITEGGIYGALAELCENAGVGARLYTDKIPLLPCSAAICKELDADPYRILSSGSLLITTREPKVLITALQAGDIKATLVGEITRGKPVAITSEGELALEVKSDEYFRITQSGGDKAI